MRDQNKGILIAQTSFIEGGVERANLKGLEFWVFKELFGLDWRII